jgi:hypothetical protein
MHEALGLILGCVCVCVCVCVCCDKFYEDPVKGTDNPGKLLQQEVRVPL